MNNYKHLYEKYRLSIYQLCDKMKEIGEFMSNARIKELSELILKHKDLYYSGKKEIEDEEYDALEKELSKLDPENYSLKVVGSVFFDGEKVKHEKKMLSLEKTYIEDIMLKWREDNVLIGTYKVDGNSASLVYNDGSFTIAKTRGDGEFGENISSQVVHISTIPKTIKTKNKVEVRGEIYCSMENFAKLAEEMVKRGIDKPKSERNIVAGILGRKDHKDLASYLSFFAFDYLSDEEATSEESKMKKLKDEKFILPMMKKISSDKDLQEFIKQTQSFMENGEYLIDGAVLTINDISKQEELGYTSHHPKYKLAFKFEGEVKETKIVDINWQISRFGVLTPVGEIEPVELAGATITNVTLHNLRTVKLFDLKKGDTIKIIRSGEVIPKFLSVVNSLDKELEVPTVCEFCNNGLVHEDVRLICPNSDCSGRHEEYILNFIHSIGIDDLSEKRLKNMMQLNLVKTIPDLYRITEEDMKKLPKTQEKMARKIVKNIEKSKQVNLIKFLSSLSFAGGARRTTELVLENGVKTFADLFNLKEESLVEIKGLAKKKASDYVDSIQANKDLINELLELGFEVEFPKSSGDLLKGKTFCITGEINIAESRKSLENIIKSNGGACSSSVSKKTDYLVCNEESSSSKYVSAKGLGIKIITEEEFQKEFSINIKK